MLIYFRLIFDVPIKTINIYTNRHRRIIELKDNLAFLRVNFFFFVGKIIIFIQYFNQLFDLSLNRLNQAVFTFSMMEILALIACDILNYKNIAKTQINR
jgi:hypothetical protein